MAGIMVFGNLDFVVSDVSDIVGKEITRLWGIDRCCTV